MPSILKRFTRPKPDEYVFPKLTAQEHTSAAGGNAAEPGAPSSAAKAKTAAEKSGAGQKEQDDAISFAQVQADKILEQARQDAQDYIEQIRAQMQTEEKQARESLKKELDVMREQAREEGYQQGFANGMGEARRKGQAEQEAMAADQAEQVKKFLEDAAQERIDFIDKYKGELKELALTIAEKVIRISLKSSGDILLRMIESATDKHKRCEWVHIYIADCDTQSMAYTIPELAAALNHLSDRVRIIPMANDESGTCMIEMPDEIIDASVSTQIGNIRDILSNTTPD